MAKTIGRLTHQLVGSAALEPGLYGDGGNLYLRVGKDVVGEDGVVKDSGRSWVFVYRHNGKQRELGLGRAGKRKGAVSLADARATAKKGRAMLDQQPPVDPRTVWRAQPKASVRTFGQAAKDYIAEKEPGWKNAKHIDQWRHTIKVYCQPLANTPVGQISVEDVRSILAPIWLRAPETASRVRVRIAAIIDHAMPVDSMQPNPALLLAKRFAKVKEAGKLDRKTGKIVPRGNFAALPHRDAPAFVARLREMDSVAARGLEFLLLTASRTGEVIGAKWSEIDLDAGLWVIPPERLKVGKRTAATVPSACVLGMREIPVRPSSRPLDSPCRPGAARGGLEAGPATFARRFATGLARRRTSPTSSRSLRWVTPSAASKAVTGARRRSIGAALLWPVGTPIWPGRRPGMLTTSCPSPARLRPRRWRRRGRRRPGS